MNLLRIMGTVFILSYISGSLALAIQEGDKSEWNKIEQERMFKEGGALGRITLTVVDDQGVPVKGAHVEASFYSTPKSKSYWGDTDKEGTFASEGRSIDDVNITIEKEGYYRTSKPYRFIDNAPSREGAIKSGKWMPWNPTITMTLKKIRNPVPMHAKDMNMPVPCDQPAGFDFEAEDIVAPFGKGVVPDVIFHVKKTEENGRVKYKWTCSFSNRLDGIQVLEIDQWSKFPWAYEAPVDGYLNGFGPFEKPREEYRHPEDVRYFYYVFRVRTMTDSNGRIVSARYGKMNTGIYSVGSEKNGCTVDFSYWYNSDGTRNLEFDPKRNLGKSWRGWDGQLYQP